MPTEQSLGGQLPFKMKGRVQQYFNDTIGLLIPDIREAGRWQAKPSGNRGPYGIRIKPFPFDLGGFQCLFHQNFRPGLLPGFKSQFPHLREQGPLLKTAKPQGFHQRRIIPAELRPRRLLPDVL
ncbi:MAG TPA: hypothetical protein VJ955_08555, partial [Desulfuromonadales bacterium]|nr:hypothetical protein [Desulfuromonadales bacterium]